MSQLTPLLEKLKESGAERVFFAPNEQGVLFDGEARRAVPGGPVRGATILEAVSELLSQDDIAGLSSRPRIVRHEHDGEDFILEIVRQPSGIAVAIRPAAKPVRSLRDSVRREEPSSPRLDQRRDAPPSPSPAPARSPARPNGERPNAPEPAMELELGSRTPAPLPDERLDTRPVQRPRVDAPARPVEAAPRAAAPSAEEVARIAREVAKQAVPSAQEIARIAREVAKEAVPSAEEIARVAREVAKEAVPSAEEIARVAREVAEVVASSVAREVLREAGAARVANGAGKVGETRRDAVAPGRGGTATIDALLREMLQKRASDLHLTTGAQPVLRVDGEIHFGVDRAPLSSSEILAMMYEIMTPRARADFEAQSDADFAYEIPNLARFRVNVFQDRQGTGAVLRQIPIEILSAEKLGLPKACLDMCWLTKGLVLVTGPTGSGKSTTLAAMIDFINKNRSDHIITIEDPVEFVHQNQKCLVNQREVGQHTKSFKNALRAALREDPDIVLVGEMRDLETISIAIETAETGHLVFGTLHTTTAISTVDRIIDQFPSDRQDQIRVMLSESLKGVVAQVLLPKIGGGRVAAHEILVGNHAVAAMIREGKTFQLASVMQTNKQQGMVTMNDSLLSLVQRKLVDPKQAYLKAVDKNGFATMLRSAGIAPPV